MIAYVKKKERNTSCYYERRQSEKATMCTVVPAMPCSGKGKTIETIERSVVARGWDGA